jgi:catechol 2,3-dioxygenase-like lactoylglutathione lyase family enzyme
MSTPRLTAAYPQLFVTDMAASCRFFTAQLGFAVAFLHGEPPFFGQVVRDGARLNLRHVDATPFNDHVRTDQHLLSAYVEVADVAGLYRAYQAANVPLHQALDNEPWGLTDFVVVDPDGNLICFSGS